MITSLVTTFCSGLQRGCDHFFSDQDHLVMAEITFRMAVIISSMAKITFVVADRTFKVIVITSAVAKIIFWGGCYNF